VSHRIVIDFMGRPLLANQVHRLHFRKVAELRKGYREGAATLARAQRIGSYDAIEVTAWAEYPSRRSLPDADAIAPSVKPVIDGLVDAGVIPDDGPVYVHRVSYQAPRVVTGYSPALVVEIAPAPSTEEGTRPSSDGAVP
jgi:crossover junction endodeoxyribonuclease RusA